ncbi:hypothetical protein EJ08DRAFT_591109 [Tothia fuscella]|uniref:Sulfotransferase family protein n=1 Tax=Tothia fuscella TaxID=1048955 RepID=A0A9P4NQ98_9PEZI|nr:hypothetical protein EJ08DRAFT_591109 [Tothia fuscella]
MKVLVLGFPRTGTQSIAAALLELACTNVYHMRVVGKNQPQKNWTAALDAKFQGGRKRADEHPVIDFDTFLHHFDAVSDFPAAIFAEELIKAYPSATVILSIRDENAWFKSMEATLVHAHANPPQGQPTAMRPLAEKYHDYILRNDFASNGRKAYREHNDFVRALGETKGSDFLEYSVKDGWEPLCKLLQMLVPSEPFPREDDWISYKARHTKPKAVKDCESLP